MLGLERKCYCYPKILAVFVWRAYFMNIGHKGVHTFYGGRVHTFLNKCTATQ